MSLRDTPLSLACSGRLAARACHGKLLILTCKGLVIIPRPGLLGCLAYLLWESTVDGAPANLHHTFGPQHELIFPLAWSHSKYTYTRHFLLFYIKTKIHIKTISFKNIEANFSIKFEIYGLSTFLWQNDETNKWCWK